MIKYKEQKYRSTPLVNITDDRVRVTMDMSINQWVILKRKLLELKLIKSSGYEI